MTKNLRKHLWVGLCIAVVGLTHFNAISQCNSCDIIYDAGNPPPANINIAGGAGPFKICLNTNFTGDINTNDTGSKTLCIAEGVTVNIGNLNKNNTGAFIIDNYGSVSRASGYELCELCVINNYGSFAAGNTTTINGTFNNFGSASLVNMNVNSSGSFINHLSSTLDVSNTVTNNGNLVNNSSINVSGSFTNNGSGNIVSGSGGNFSIGGAFSNNGRICGPNGLGTGFCLAFQVAGSAVNNGQIATDCNSGATPGGAVSICSPAAYAQNGTVGTGYVFLPGTNNCPCQILTPVIWHSISASNVQNGVLVQWSTLREENNLLFRVQRSTDAIDFETIAELKGSLNTQGLRHYQHLDGSTMPTALLYYRIEQEDEDGTVSLSRMVSSRINNSQPFIYPNPLAAPATSFVIAGSSGRALLSITSPSGGVLVRLQLEALQQQVQLPVPLSAGLYIVSIATDAGTSKHKLVVQ